MSFYREQEIKSSRKACRCFWCGQVIAVGCPKITIANVWEGDFFFSKFHPECREAVKLWRKEYPEEELWPDEGSMDRGKITGQEYHNDEAK